MTYRGHLIVGGGSSVAALWTLLPADVAWPVRATLAVVALFGALLPDADCPQSWLGKRLLGLPWLVKFAISNPLTWVVAGHRDAGMTRWHRRLTHWRRREAPSVSAMAPQGSRVIAAVWGGLRRGVATATLAWYLPWRWMVNGRQRLAIVVRHRGYSHSMLALLLLTGLGLVAFLVAYGVGTRRLPEWAIRRVFAPSALRPLAWVGWHTAALALGIASHLVLDACTIEGIPLWLPVSRRRIHLLPPALRVRSV